MLANFHTHSTFCDGNNTPEEVVRAAIELGFSALLVSERLGHENVSTTLNIYAHLFPIKAV